MGIADKVKECPELYAGQSAGRPIWQSRLPLHTLEYLDLMADRALQSEEAFQAYKAATEIYR